MKNGNSQSVLWDGFAVRVRSQRKSAACPRVVHGLRAAQPGSGDGPNHPQNRGSGGQRVGRLLAVLIEALRAVAAELRSSGRRSRTRGCACESQSAPSRKPLRARSAGRALPPSPYHADRPRPVDRFSGALTGLLAALRHSARLCAGFLPVGWRGTRLLPRESPRSHKSSLCRRAASTSLCLLRCAAIPGRSRTRPARAARCASRLRAIPGLPRRVSRHRSPPLSCAQADVGPPTRLLRVVHQSQSNSGLAGREQPPEHAP